MTPVVENIKFILVDDDPTVNFLHTAIIKSISLNIEVEAFEDPQKALDSLKLDKSSYRTILLDVNMPVINGWQFLDLLEEKNLGIPVIMLTSSIIESDRQKAREASHVSDFQIKPFSKNKFNLVFKKIIKDING